MSIILYINGKQADVSPGTQIRQNLQINTLGELNTRQCNYTNAFTIPKTGRNREIMEHMTVTGNVSLVPYQKNTCSLYSTTGECFVYNGWAIIEDAGDNYNVAIYEGVIDLFKAIENKNLSYLKEGAEDLLAPLNHQKDIATIKQSWQDYLDNGDYIPYLYILADYNGNTGNTNLATPEVNIDYLVPSVNVYWLWDRVMEKFGITYSGAVFETFAFRNLWMTFPKGVQADSGTTVFEFGPSDNFDLTTYGWYVKTENITTNMLEEIINDKHFRPGVAGSYKVRITGNLKTFGSTSTPPPTKFILGKNMESDPEASPIGILVADEVDNTETLDINTGEIFSLGENDSISLFITKASSLGFYDGYNLHADSEFTFELIRIDPAQVDFSEAFTDFAIKDFVNEVVQRFGLTIFTYKYSGVIEFLTLQEQLQGNATLNWSAKFSKKVSENYAFGSYARLNWFRYNYNDKESTHHDGYISVDNINLSDTRDVIKSKIYAPERVTTSYMNGISNVYPLWNKEVKEDSTINYKPLDKRYYFMRATVRSGGIELYSDELSEGDTATVCYRESFYKLSFQETIQGYYLPLQRILDRTVIVVAEMMLTEYDIANFDFKKIIYIEQLSNYFIVNKINDYMPGKLTKVELVRVLYTTATQVQPVIKITRYKTQGSLLQVYFELTQAYPYINLDYRLESDTGWSSIGFASGINPYPYPLTTPGDYIVRLRAVDYLSDEISITIPSNEDVIID